QTVSPPQPLSRQSLQCEFRQPMQGSVPQQMPPPGAVSGQNSDPPPASGAKASVAPVSRRALVEASRDDPPPVRAVSPPKVTLGTEPQDATRAAARATMESEPRPRIVVIRTKGLWQGIELLVYPHTSTRHVGSGISHHRERTSSHDVDGA